jgi:predicted dehydrogenase
MNHTTSRRRFLQGSATAVAAAGISRFTALSYGQIAGSNEAIQVGVVGFNGRGNAHIDEFRKMKGVRLGALCDADEAVLNKGYSRVMRAAPATQPSATAPASAEARPPRVEKFIDVRKLLDNKNINAISVATPNHWHALITIWGCQAGKDVYVEKPVSHDVWEGQKMVQAARKYNRIVQAGTQNRSNLPLKEAIEWVQAGNLGKILSAHTVCYRRRGTIDKVDATPPVPASVNLDLWCGPSPLEAPHRKQFHYDWHWFWQTGNGEIGNNGIHQIDVARWAINKHELSSSILSVGGRFGYDDDGQTPNTHFAVHNFGDILLIAEFRGLPAKPGSAKMDTYKHAGDTGQVIECENGFLSNTTTYDKKGEVIRNFAAKKYDMQGNHFANFIDAVRTRDVSELHADIEQGRLSTALCHTPNISHRLGQKVSPDEIKEAVKFDADALETFERFKEHLAVNEVDISMDKAVLGMPLKMDPKTERFIGNDKANEMLKGTYRAPFVVPENV